MSIGRYFLVMTLATLVSWGAFVLVLMNVDPYDGGIAGRALLLVALFFSTFGTLSIAGFLARMWRRKGVALYWHVLFAFRQALIVSALMLGALILQAARMLNGWNMILLLLGATLVEVYFLTRQPRRQHV